MGQATNISAEDALDLVITNALIVDWTGIKKVLHPRPNIFVISLILIHRLGS